MSTTNNTGISTSIGEYDNCWLNNFSALKNCSEQLRSQIIMNTQTTKYNKGDLLIKNGDVGGGVFCVQSGIVKVSTAGNKNKEFILWIAGAGDLIGLNSLTDDEPFSYSASAVDAVTAYFIPSADLKLLLEKEPAVSVELMRNLCDKLDFIEKRITSISRKKIREQCAEMLISIATKSAIGTGRDAYINYSISELASFVGTTKSYLYKILLSFASKKILSFHKRKIVISNMTVLSLIAAGNDK